MEIFTGDREAFPQHVSPFPDLTAMIESAELSLLGDHPPNLPPRKLRPIRYHGRSPPSSQVDDPSDFTEPPEVFRGLMCAVKPDSGECLEPPIKPEVNDVVNIGGGGEEEGPRSSEQKGEPSCSSYSDSDDNDLSATLNAPLNKKRKRKRRKNIELFLEKMVTKVMERQEQMHNQLIEMIEKREKERIAKEEAWKQQEMERIRKDEEARAQETSRSLALISFIHNALGYEIEMPMQSTTTSCMEENGGKDMSEDHIQNDIFNVNDPINRWQEGRIQAKGGESHLHQDVGINSDPNSKRWPDAEVQALIMLRSALENKFRIAGSKCSIWDDISVEMYKMGYCRSAKKCKEKWENINKYFRKSMGSGKKHLENTKRCPYFNELDMLYKNGLGSIASHVKLTTYENEESDEASKVVKNVNT